jgi:hypothetical protein
MVRKSGAVTGLRRFRPLRFHCCPVSRAVPVSGFETRTRATDARSAVRRCMAATPRERRAATAFGPRLLATYYPEEMTKLKQRPRRDVTMPTPYEEARDEMFQHIMQCGVIGAHPDDQKEWFDATMQYMTGRYPELGDTQLGELRALGERFAQPLKPKTAEPVGA